MALLINVNSLTKGEVVAEMSCRGVSSHYVETHEKECRRWMVVNIPEKYKSVGQVSSHQTQTARSGDYTRAVYDSDTDSDSSEEEATTSDEEFVEDDMSTDDDDDDDDDYESSDEEMSSSDSEMSD